MPCYCELCGREVPTEKLCRTVVVEGAVMKVCPRCYQRLVRQGKVKEYIPEKPRTTTRKWSRTRISSRILMEEYEVVPDYPERIRRARMRMGWTTKVLAEKARESENVIKRIEAGRLVPSIRLARTLEKLLRIKLLEPIVDEEYTPVSSSHSEDEDYFTVGDLIRIRDRK